MNERSPVAIGLVVVLGLAVVGMVVLAILGDSSEPLAFLAVALGAGLLGYIAPRGETVVEEVPLTGPDRGAWANSGTPADPADVFGPGGKP